MSFPPPRGQEGGVPCGGISLNQAGECYPERARSEPGPYHGITGNCAALANFWQGVQRRWGDRLSRRSHRAYVSWAGFYRLMERYPLPPPVIVHSVLRRAANR